MKISDEIVDHIAHLSRLEFIGNEKTAIKADLEKIIDFMGKLNELDTQNIEPLIFMSEETNRLREDIPEVSISHEEALKNAPKKDSDYFRIPKVLDKKNA
jgi:aspartyl-tRNA(Asn)/glutamyl-tRNA(Gln) amidotransferase subunit C